LKWTRTILSVALFAAGILVLTARDQLIHGILYNYGLTFSYAWANWDWTIYFLQFQILAIATALIADSRNLLVLYEAFVLSATQDLVFYAVWNNMAFPSTEWWWGFGYKLFGTWNTGLQFAWSITILSATTCFLAWRSLHNRTE
jgi:hypothetical protein